MDGAQLIGERNVRRPYGHASGLHADIDAMLGEADSSLSDLEDVVGVGPGSFTGIRVGMAAAKGLAYALEIPLCCVSSADALLRYSATQAARSPSSTRAEEGLHDRDGLDEPLCSAPEGHIGALGRVSSACTRRRGAHKYGSVARGGLR